jgi:ribonuclease HI
LSVKKVTIHSDGACEGNPGPGGWAAVLQYGNHRRVVSGGCAATTNNRMEMQAAIEGLRLIKEPCEIDFYTDSQYLREGITLWVAGWKRRHWRTKERKPVKNQDFWMELDAQASRHKIAWHWLKGHAGHVENERCDQLAQMEIDKIRRAYHPDELKKQLATFVAERSANPTPQTPVQQGPSELSLFG